MTQLENYEAFYKNIFKTIETHYNIKEKAKRIPRKQKKKLKKLFMGNIGQRSFRKHQVEKRQLFINMVPFWTKMYRNFIIEKMKDEILNGVPGDFNPAHVRGISPLKGILERYNPKKDE